VFTPEAWACFHSLLEPSLNTNGWGMDHLLHSKCRAKIGLIDEFAVKHVQGIKGANRTASGRESFPSFRGRSLNEEEQEAVLVCTKLGCCSDTEGGGSRTESGAGGGGGGCSIGHMVEWSERLKQRHRSGAEVLGALKPG
jgi:hypothetical protein